MANLDDGPQTLQVLQRELGQSGRMQHLPDEESGHRPGFLLYDYTHC